MGEKSLSKKGGKQATNKPKKTDTTESTQKAVVVGIVIIVVIVLVWVIKAAVSPDGTPTQGVSDDPTKGGSDPLVVIEEYSDFECPACLKMAPQLRQAVEEFGDDISVVYNDFPLPVNIHKYAFIAAEAGQCVFANEGNDAFWTYHDKLFEEQDVWASQATSKQTEDLFKGYVAELEYDTDAFEACLDKHEQRAIVQEDVNEGDAAEVQSTSTLFINGERYAGVGAYSSLQKEIKDQLKKAREQSGIDGVNGVEEDTNLTEEIKEDGSIEEVN